MQFISHEELARDNPVDPAAVRDVGRVEVLETFGKGQRGWAAVKGGARTPVVLPSVTPHLKDGRVEVVNPDDQVMEVLTPHPFPLYIRTLLHEAGLTDNEIGDAHKVLTDPAHLAAAIGGIRPGAIRHEFVRKANLRKFEFQDRHVGLTIEGFPTNARKFGDRPVNLFQMSVAEGGPEVSAGKSTTTLVGLNTAIPGLSELFGKDSFNALIELTYGHGWYKTQGTSDSLSLTQGRLLQATRTYLEATADVVYRVHVTGQNKSLGLDGDVEYFGQIIRVKDGLSWLTLAKPAADPRDDPPKQAPDPDTVMVIGRRPPGDPKAQAQQAPKGLRRRLVDFVRATRSKGDHRKVPWVQFLPPSTASEWLYPKRKRSAGSPDVSGEGNPVVDAVQEMLRQRAPWALESHTTFEIELPGTGDGTRRTGKRRVRGRLANVLNLRSMTMMMDMLTSTGLVVHAIGQGPGYNRRAQIVLQARRDPHNLGYVYLESIEGNTTRYTTGLDQKNRNWTKLQSGAVATAASQTGAPTNTSNATPAPSAPGGGAPGQATGPSTGFNGWTLHPEGDIGQSTGKGGYHQTIDAQRDTLFHAGRADRYGGDVDLAISLITTTEASTLANKVGLNLPRLFASWVQRTANHRSQRHTVIVPLKERVLIPHGLIHHEITPSPPPDGTLAVEEVPLQAAPGPAAGALNITAEDLLKRKVLNLGWDGRKLQVLFPELMARLAGNERPLSGHHSNAVARLTEYGTRVQDDLRYIFSAPMLNRYLERMLGQEGMTMPTLVREGGTLTDTYGDVTVQVELAPDPLVLSNYTIWDEGVGYGFDEAGQALSREAGWSFGLTGGAAIRTGNLHHATPPAPNVASFSLSASVGTSEERSGTAVQQHLTKGEAVHRALSWLRVSPDAKITVRFKARNERDWIEASKIPGFLGGEWLGGGEVAFSFLLRNALELALSPEASIDNGIYHPGGIPVGSGTFFPPPPGRRPVGTEDLVRHAYSLPFLEGAFGVQIDWDGEYFWAGDRQITATELAAQVKIRLAELGDPPSPDLAEEERPPPGPTKLKDPNDPIVLISPNAAVRAPGQAVSPAQALADALGRPVLAPDSSYRIMRDGSVLAVRQLTPDATVLGRGWQDGQWVAVFPRAKGQDPRPLTSRNLADAIREARDELKWTLKVTGRPELVPSPRKDAHYPVQSSPEALSKWRDDVAAVQRLAAAARDLLPHTGNRQADLARELDRADSATRAVPAPPATLPVPEVERAPIWQNLTQFHDAAADLGRVVTEVLNTAFTEWQQLIDQYRQQSERARRLLQRNGELDPAAAKALDKLDAAVREIPEPPAGLPATAAQVSDTVAAMGRIAERQRAADSELSNVLTLGVKQLDTRVPRAENMARAVARLLPYTGKRQGRLGSRLIVAQPAPPELPLGPSMQDERVEAAWEALQRVADLEGATRDVVTAATALNRYGGLSSRVAAAPDLARAAGVMLPYAGEHQGRLQFSLDEAFAQLKDAKPSWWLMNGPELTTADDIEAARQWLAGDGPDGLTDAVQHLESVVSEVASTANQTAERLERLVRRANELLPDTGAHAGNLGLQLYRAHGIPAGARFTAPRWPELRPAGRHRTAAEVAEAAAEIQAAAAKHAAFVPSAERLEKAVRAVLAAAITEWQTRLATAQSLLGRLSALPEVAEKENLLQWDLAAYHRNTLTFAFALNQLDGPHTAEDMDEARQVLDEVTFEYQSVEAAIRGAIAIAVDEPMRIADTAAGLANQMDGLLPYAGEQNRNDLLQQRAVWAAAPNLSSVLEPVAPRPLAELDKALSKGLVRLRQLSNVTPDFTRVLPRVLAGGWQPFADEMGYLVGQAQELLERTGGRLADERRQTLAAALNAAERELSKLREPEQRPDLPESPVVDELDAVRQALTSVAAAKAPVGEVIDEVNARLAERTTAVAARRRVLRAELNLTGGTEPGAALLRSRPPSAAETSEFTRAIDTAKDRETWLRRLEEETRGLFAGATNDVDDRRERVEDAEHQASDVQALRPYINGAQASLSRRVDQAVADLRMIRPSWWRTSETDLTTAEEVEAVRQTGDPRLPERLERAAAEIEESVLDLIGAVDHDRWARRVEELREAASQAQDLLPPPGWRRTALEAAMQKALARLDAGTAIQQQLAPVTELEAAIRRVTDAAAATARQRAGALVNLIPQVRGLLPLTAGRLGADLTTARQAVRDLIDPPAQRDARRADWRRAAGRGRGRGPAGSDQSCAHRGHRTTAGLGR